jgi:amino acid adenylation domain-containing protein
MFPAEQLLHTVQSRGPRVALWSAGTAWSYDDLDRRSQSLAEQLQDLGVGPGERVGIDLANQASAVAAIWACLRLGAAFACLDPTTPSRAWAALIDDFFPRIVLTRAERLRACDVATGSRYLVDRAGLDGVGQEISSFDLERPPDGRSFVRGSDPSAQAANLVYTSGSTGRPKAVVMSHAAVGWAVQAIGGYLDLSAEDAVLNILPLSFDYGLYQVLLCGSVGACLVLEPGLGYPGPLLETLRDRAVTTVPGVPSLFHMLLQRPSFDARTLPSLRRFTNTGAHLPLDTVRAIRARFPAADLYLMYGLTECKRVSYLPPREVDAHPDSVGIPMPGCDVAVVDDDGQPLGPNRVGQLVLRSRSMMLGYWRREAETEAALRPGPWPGERCLWTGDLFLRDGNGLLYFVGRMDDIFKSRGEKVAPVEVERALRAHEGVAEASVVPAPDPVLGARICAFVVYAEGHAPDERSLKHHCAERLEPFKLPHRIAALPRLPLNSRGKVDRAALMALAASEQATAPHERS